MPRMKFGFDTILSIDIDVYHAKYARVDAKKKNIEKEQKNKRIMWCSLCPQSKLLKLHL